jgi:hypothetical protein
MPGTSDPKKYQTRKKKMKRGGGGLWEPPPHAHECVLDVLGWTYILFLHSGTPPMAFMDEKFVDFLWVGHNDTLDKLY